MPSIIFSDIIMMVELQSLQEVGKCRQVCHIWNVMISQMTKCKKHTIAKKSVTLNAHVRKEWKERSSFPKLPEILMATSLAYEGLVRSVNKLGLKYVDLASVPSEHLAALASCVTEDIFIVNASNCDLISIFQSLKCLGLHFAKQNLGSEETRALVQAMESNVQNVTIMIEVNLDMEILAQYSGAGKCDLVEFWIHGDGEDQRWNKVKNKIAWEHETNEHHGGGGKTFAFSINSVEVSRVMSFTISTIKRSKKGPLITQPPMESYQPPHPARTKLNNSF